MHGNTGVDYSALYLNDQIHEGHPMFAELNRMYGPTPEGQKLQKFWDQNEMYLDGLERAGPGTLDMIITQEGVSYAGDVYDRIRKIQEIRKHRDTVEQDLLSGMDESGRVEFLAKKKAKQDQELASRRKLAEDQPVVQKKIDKAEAKAAKRAEYIANRQKQKDEHRRLAQAQGDQVAARAGTFVHPLAPPVAGAKDKQTGTGNAVADAQKSTLQAPEDTVGNSTARASSDAATGNSEASMSDAAKDEPKTPAKPKGNAANLKNVGKKAGK